MQSNSVKVLSRMMEGLCTACMALGAAVIVSLPWTLRWYLRYYYGHSAPGRQYAFMLGLLYLSGICAFIILGYGRRILRDIVNGNPFTFSTARRIRAIAGWCAPIGLGYLLGTLALPSVFVVLVGLAFSFAAVLVLILSELFRQAAGYKQENDLTI
ncbi:MAG: DUF2975 domain-containing protein [Provencibacterium sp.]|nr:DUF2975 domain-containing protein [Provencibacterium sp.]